MKGKHVAQRLDRGGGQRRELLKKGRRCRKCNCLLSGYNTSDCCFACQKKKVDDDAKGKLW